MHEVLVNRLGGLSLPRKNVVRLTDRPDMTLDVYRGRKTTIQQQQQLFQRRKESGLILLCKGLKGKTVSHTNDLNKLEQNSSFFSNGCLKLSANILVGDLASKACAFFSHTLLMSRTCILFSHIADVKDMIHRHALIRK